MTPQMIQTLIMMRNEATQTVPAMFANINTLYKQGQTSQPAFLESIFGACVGTLMISAIDMIGSNQQINGNMLLDALRNNMPFNIWSIANQQGLPAKALEFVLGKLQQTGVIGNMNTGFGTGMTNPMFGGNFQQPSFGGGGASVGMLTATTYSAPPQGTMNPGSIQSSGKFGSAAPVVAQPAQPAPTALSTNFTTYTPPSNTALTSTPQMTKPVMTANLNYILVKGLSAVVNGQNVDIVGYEDKDNPSQPIPYRELDVEKKPIGEVINCMFFSGKINEEPLEKGMLYKMPLSYRVTDISTVNNKKLPYFDKYFTALANLYLFIGANKRIGDFVTDSEEIIKIVNENIPNAKNRTYLLEKLDMLKFNYKNNKEECLKSLVGRFENTVKYVTTVEHEALFLYHPEVMEAFTKCELGNKFVLTLSKYSYPTLFKAFKEANAQDRMFYLLAPTGYLAFAVLSNHDLDTNREEEFKLCLVYSTIPGIE